MAKEHLSALIIDLRQRLGISQEKLAAQLGVSFQTINRWENQRVKPSAMAEQLIKQRLSQMGEQGKELLDKYYSESSSSSNL
ncbi:helix-turn-helix domain-containing protein [Leptolyngbya sp. AN03gr2]|uniref:helix-turn-helix domain-containing protein n=1 Tax=unclassified Leptolyngbya TaxID=2650499 RepID=UPI003D318F2B